jgi:hypothetical protein
MTNQTPNERIKTQRLNVIAMAIHSCSEKDATREIDKLIRLCFELSGKYTGKTDLTDLLDQP